MNLKISDLIDCRKTLDFTGLDLGDKSIIPKIGPYHMHALAFLIVVGEKVGGGYPASSFCLTIPEIDDLRNRSVEEIFSYFHEKLRNVFLNINEVIEELSEPQT